MTLLEVKNITKNFGGLCAVSNLDFEIGHGEIIGLIGPNGAGKTTVFNLISGVYKPNSGIIRFQNEIITGLKPHIIAQKGMVRTFQNTSLFHGMTVLENLAVAGHYRFGENIFETIVTPWTYKRKKAALMEKAQQILGFMGIDNKQNELPANLAYGHQRILGICIALATEPRMLLLDEPAAGMNPSETLNLMELLVKIKETGVSILLVEHDMKLVMGICERIVAVSFGKKLAEGSPEAVQKDKNVIKAYLGG